MENRITGRKTKARRSCESWGSNAVQEKTWRWKTHIIWQVPTPWDSQFLGKVCHYFNGWNSRRGRKPFQTSSVLDRNCFSQSTTQTVTSSLPSTTSSSILYFTFFIEYFFSSSRTHRHFSYLKSFQEKITCYSIFGWYLFTTFPLYPHHELLNNNCHGLNMF